MVACPTCQIDQGDQSCVTCGGAGEVAPEVLSRMDSIASFFCDCDDPETVVYGAGQRPDTEDPCNVCVSCDRIVLA